MVVKACISDTHTLDKSVFLTIVHRRRSPIAGIEHLTQKFDTWQGTFLAIVHVKVGAYFQDITDVGDYFSDASWPQQWWPSMWSPRTLSRHQPELALESNAQVHPGQLAEQRPLYVWCMSRSLECTLPSLPTCVLWLRSKLSQSSCRDPKTHWPCV